MPPFFQNTEKIPHFAQPKERRQTSVLRGKQGLHIIINKRRNTKSASYVLDVKLCSLPWPFLLHKEQEYLEE
jgi:hypothetical protein